MSEKHDRNDVKGHPTTRRSFIMAAGFAPVSLYGLWALYGAAPTVFSLTSSADDGGTTSMAGMAGMDQSGDDVSPEEFRALTERFVEKYTTPDDTVWPRPEPTATPAGAAACGRNCSGGDEPGMTAASAVAAAGAPAVAAANAPVDVYLMASRYGYEPSSLRLEPGVRYRFRIMAMDAMHGASMNFGSASRIIRCPARTLVEQEMSFSRPGKFLVYCTVYCGEGHDLMHSTIVVA